MASIKHYRLIMDNGGGITMQLGDWVHYYNGAAAQLADDIAAWMRDGDTAGWDGHDPEADCSAAESDYVVVLDRAIDTIASVAAELLASGGAAARIVAYHLASLPGDSGE